MAKKSGGKGTTLVLVKGNKLIKQSGGGKKNFPKPM